MNNSVITTVPGAQSLPSTSSPAQPTPPAPSQSTTTQEELLVSAKVTDENSALNILVSFLGIAQRRGCFALDEAAKIFECIQVFQKNK